MAPVDAVVDDEAKKVVQENIEKHGVMVFSKTTCPYCKKVKQLFESLNIQYGHLELDQLSNGAAIQEALLALSGQKTVPNVFINRQHIGGCDKTHALHAEGKLLPLVSASKEESYDFDLIVLGGGSGGLAAAKEAAKLGKAVAVCDFVKPSPLGTTWGLGGTCVNVGCIPKKLMHQAALLGHGLEDARAYGWEFDTQVKHNWATMRDAVQDHIGSLNWGYRVQLREKNVKYLNAYASFIEPHKIQAIDKKGKTEIASARHFIIATGLRPKYLNIPGGEYAISSDDLFSLAYCPGKTLCVGASYISLECAGFLAGIGLEATVMVRSILLRGFDQQMAEIVGSYMEKHGVRFIRGAIPTKIEQIAAGEPGRYRVTATADDGSVVVDEYNTVLFAIGRDAQTSDLGLDKVGIALNPKNGKVIGQNGGEQSSVDHVYAIGDILDGKPELTPVAIEAGKLLANRLYGGAHAQCDYVNVPTTVFTPLEYGAIGLSEEDAIAQYGAEDVEVYHSNFTPLEWTVPHREDNLCYAKLVCVKSLSDKVVGFHLVGPNAGEITQGYGVAMKCGATKAHFDATIGIHPTCAEIFTTLETTKSSGASTLQAGC